MLTRPQLVALERSLRDERVLSVYLHGASEDPAQRLVWRRDLDRALRDLRRWLADSAHDERTAFERCVTQLEEQLARFVDGLPTPGWVAFVTADRMHQAESLPVAIPTMATWSTGICIAPYMRALKSTRLTIIAVADAREVRIYRHRAGELALLDTIHSHAIIDRPSHMGDVPRTGFHAGVHGEPARDAAQRARLAGADRMVRHAELALRGYAGRDGWILVGGAPAVCSRLARSLETTAPGRYLHLASLDVNATAPVIAAAARAGANALGDAADLQELNELIDAPQDGGQAAVGPAAVRGAIAQWRVRDLYLTPRFVEEHTAEAEEAVREALGQGAGVKTLERDAAAALDAHGGLAARLRYRLTSRIAPSDADATAEASRHRALAAPSHS